VSSFNLSLGLTERAETRRSRVSIQKSQRFWACIAAAVDPVMITAMPGKTRGSCGNHKYSHRAKATVSVQNLFLSAAAKLQAEGHVYHVFLVSLISAGVHFVM
jgi:hypothetical protein